jgi:hypothetical protein
MRKAYTSARDHRLATYPSIPNSFDCELNADSFLEGLEEMEARGPPSWWAVLLLLLRIKKGLFFKVLFLTLAEQMLTFAGSVCVLNTMKAL